MIFFLRLNDRYTEENYTNMATAGCLYTGPSLKFENKQQSQIKIAIELKLNFTTLLPVSQVFSSPFV